MVKVWQKFDDEGRMKSSAWYDRIVDVRILKGHTGYLSTTILKGWIAAF